jgi:hypothetical protein
MYLSLIRTLIQSIIKTVTRTTRPELTNCTYKSDLTHTFDNHKQTIFFDLGHVGDEGNMIIAEEIYKLVLPVIQKN